MYDNFVTLIILGPEVFRFDMCIKVSCDLLFMSGDYIIRTW